MKFEVYCDESMPDLFTTKKPAGRYLDDRQFVLAEFLSQPNQERHTSLAGET